MILVVSLLTPFTMSARVSLFFAFRIIQTRLMLLSIVHGLSPNQKLKAILEGCANLDHLWGSTLEAHQRFSQAFFLPQSVYIRFTHIHNFQPKFYLGSALHHVLDREYSRTRKYCQLTHDRLVQAEPALRYWREHQNLFVWAPIPLFTCRTDFRCMELALIQEWQPRLNFPFICQFFHPKKGLLKRPAMNTNAQFGLATLWHRYGTVHVIVSLQQPSKPFWHRTDSRADFNYGISSMIWVPTQRPDLTPPDYFVLRKGVFISATPYAG